MNTAAFYDTKTCDREYFERAPEADRLRCQFHEFRLTTETAASVDGAQAVCVLVNDRLDAPCLKQLQLKRRACDDRQLPMLRSCE